MNESTTKIGEILEKSDVEDGNTQTPTLENITGTQSLRDTLTLMKRSKIFLKIEEKLKGDVIWNGIFIQPLGENRINVTNEKYDIIRNIQKYFTNTKLTTKSMDNDEKETVFDIFDNVGFYDEKTQKV